MNNYRLEFVIPLSPIPWSAHRGYGRKSFNPRYKEKEYVQWQLKSQKKIEAPLTCPIRVDVLFYMPIPKTTSRVRRKEMLHNKIHHTKRPDLTNLYKFTEDCLKGIVFEDDSQVCEVELKKVYSEIPKIAITVSTLYSEN